MTVRYLLDTIILSDLVRNPQGPITERIREVGEAQIGTSVIVAGELRYGAAKRNSPRLSEQLEKILDVIQVVGIESPIDEAYGLIRRQLEQAGTPIGANDLWIAAQAQSLDCVLVTDNEREFVRVSGLTVENWRREAR